VVPGLGVDVIVLSFAVVVIGGLGSLPGAALGAVIVGLVRSVSVHYMPQVELFVIYFVMPWCSRSGPAACSASRSLAGYDARPHAAAARRDSRRGRRRRAGAAAMGAVHPHRRLRARAGGARTDAAPARGARVLRPGAVLLHRRVYGRGLARAFKIGDIFVQMFAGSALAALVALVLGFLLARYRGIFFGLLSLALSMILYG